MKKQLAAALVAMLIASTVFLVMLPCAPSALAQYSWTDTIDIYKNIEVYTQDFRKIQNNQTVAVDVNVYITFTERIYLLEYYRLSANGTTFIVISEGIITLFNNSYYGLGVGHTLCFNVEAEGATALDTDDIVRIGVKVELWSAEYTHDIAITAITPFKTIVGQGYLLSISVNVENQGNFTETFKTSLYANATSITSQENLTISPGNTSAITFNWDTTGWTKGNYTMHAYADPVLGETDNTDNTLFSSKEVCVTIPGDVDGDRDVDIFDIVHMAGVYGVEYPNPRYDSNCDIDGDGDIDIFDLVKAAGNYGKSW